VVPRENVLGVAAAGFYGPSTLSNAPPKWLQNMQESRIVFNK